MSKFFRNLLFSLIASVGLFIIIVVVLDLCNRCSCRSGACSSSDKKSGTKIKRNYTQITLPEE